MISDKDREEALNYEDLIAEIQKRRNPPSRKAWWESAGLISSMTAVLTVALTSGAGLLVQRALREQDLAAKHSDESYARQVATLQSSHSLATESAHYATERLRIADGTYGKLSHEQLVALVDSVNVADTRWRQGREVQRVGIELQFGPGGDVLMTWDSLTSRLDRFATCTVVGPFSTCPPMRTAVDSALTQFRHIAIAFIRSHSGGQ